VLGVQINDVRCMLVFSQIDRATPLRGKEMLGRGKFIRRYWMALCALPAYGRYLGDCNQTTRSALLYMAFGLGATFALILMTSALQVHDFVAFIVLFIILMYLSYVVAQKLDQL
jgi:hypothetical protein